MHLTSTYVFNRSLSSTSSKKLTKNTVLAKYKDCSSASISNIKQNCNNQHCDLKEALLVNNCYHSSNKPFFIIHINIRSLQKNFHQLENLLYDFNSAPDLIALSETWHDNSSFFKPKLPNYDFVCCTSSCNRAGGVAIFLRNCFNLQVRNDIKLITDKCEDIWVEVKGHGKKSMIIGLIYRHPGCNISNFHKNFEELLIKLNTSTSKQIYITGDFNIDYSNKSNLDYFKTISSLGFNQLVNCPTRETIHNHSSSIIDHFYSNQQHSKVNIKILIHDLSDHFPVLAWIENANLSKIRPKKQVRRDMKSFSEETFTQDLFIALDNISVENSDNVDDLFLQFTKTFINTIDKNAPYRELTRREQKIKQKPWITQKIRKAILKKNKLYKKSIKSKNPTDQHAYKTFSNSLNSLKKQSKKKYYDQLVKNSKNSSKRTWKVINDIVNLKKGKDKSISQIKDENGNQISEPNQIAQTVNKFFVNIGKKLSSTFPSTNSKLNFASNKKSFFFKPITEYEIRRHISQMDESKSVRPCDPQIKFIKIAKEVVSPFLSEIFNFCVTKGKYPKDLKKACVIPVFKKGERNLCGNYRPISLISPFSKIFERCILSQLNTFFSSFSILSDKQFGFKKNVSTEMALSNVYESFLSNFENKQITCAIFLDIAKAFDSVNHQLLLNKLECYGVRGLPQQLIESYLSDRSQYTIIDNNASSPLPITCGVPQGSVLAPFLFSVFINDLPNVTYMQTTLFADDACFSYGSTNIDNLEQKVNSELTKIGTWFQENKLALNIDKTHFILIHRKNKNTDIQINLNGTRLSQKSQIKYLGVIIDEKLNWKPQVNSCVTKLNKCLWAISKLRRFTNTSTLRLIYFSFAYPYLQYGISSWGGACQSTLQPLLVKQKFIVKCMLFQSYSTPSSPLFSQLGLLKLNEVYKFQICQLIFNQLKNNITILPNLASLSDIHSHNTRSANKQILYIPFYNSNLGKSSLSYNGTSVWNSIPIEIRNSSTLKFKRLLKKHFLENYLP